MDSPLLAGLDVSDLKIEEAQSADEDEPARIARTPEYGAVWGVVGAGPQGAARAARALRICTAAIELNPANYSAWCGALRSCSQLLEVAANGAAGHPACALLQLVSAGSTGGRASRSWRWATGRPSWAPNWTTPLRSPRRTLRTTSCGAYQIGCCRALAWSLPQMPFPAISREGGFPLQAAPALGRRGAGRRQPRARLHSGRAGGGR
jgi:hypothetical protein